jgi:hypothetical protein
MGRVDMQISRALSRLKDKGEHDFQRDEILAEMNQVQVDLCKDYLALKVKFNLTTVANQATYDLDSIDLITGTTYRNIWKVKESIEPTTWKYRIIWVHDSDIWAHIKRRTLSGTPRYGFTWNKTIELYPAPTTAETITVLAYAMPLVDLAYGADFELDQEWDEAIMLGACKNLAGGGFFDLYNAECEKVSQQRIKESINGVQKIDYAGMDRWSGEHHHHHDISDYTDWFPNGL